MIIVMKGGIPKEQVHDVIRTIEELGYQPTSSGGHNAPSSARSGMNAGRPASTRWRSCRAWRAWSPSSSPSSWPAASSGRQPA